MEPNVDVRSRNSDLKKAPTPASVRDMAENRDIYPLLKHQTRAFIKNMAVEVYTQTKLIPIYHKQICNEYNELGFFLCAVHRRECRKRTSLTSNHSRTASSGSGSSTSSHGSLTKCDQIGLAIKACDLPSLPNTGMLSLGHWEGVYYALYMNIKNLHQDMLLRLQSGFVQESDTLHSLGRSGHDDKAFTVRDFVDMLEEDWSLLTNPCLVATLEEDVRRKNMQHFGGTNDTLIDVNTISPQCMTMKIREWFAPVIAIMVMPHSHSASAARKYFRRRIQVNDAAGDQTSDLLRALASDPPPMGEEHVATTSNKEEDVITKTDNTAQSHVTTAFGTKKVKDPYPLQLYGGTSEARPPPVPAKRTFVAAGPSYGSIADRPVVPWTAAPPSMEGTFSMDASQLLSRRYGRASSDGVVRDGKKGIIGRFKRAFNSN